MDKPILFSSPMVRAILEGRKTQTRRVVNFVPGDAGANIEAHIGWLSVEQDKSKSFTFYDCVGPKKYTPDAIYADGYFSPYGQAGDQLWVRETWGAVSPDEYVRPLEECKIEYRADLPVGSTDFPGEWPADEARGSDEAPRWRPSIHMPRWASRITLDVVNVRVERVQEITREDAKAEGVDNVWHWDEERNARHPEHFRRGLLNPYVANYSVLWDAINSGRGFGWDANPWVWVIEFKVVQNAS